MIAAFLLFCILAVFGLMLAGWGYRLGYERALAERPCYDEMCEFVLWLSPCGQLNTPPHIEKIGTSARFLLKRTLEKKGGQK